MKKSQHLANNSWVTGTGQTAINHPQMKHSHFCCEGSKNLTYFPYSLSSWSESPLLLSEYAQLQIHTLPCNYTSHCLMQSQSLCCQGLILSTLLKGIFVALHYFPLHWTAFILRLTIKWAKQHLLLMIYLVLVIAMIINLNIDII